jgi:dynein heavy chain
MARNTKLLLELEASLLSELESSSENILDNSDLVVALEETKAKSVAIKAKNDQAELTKQTIHMARSEYVAVAKRGTTLQSAFSGLSKLDPMYETSLRSFFAQFIKALSRAEDAQDVQQRVENLCKSCTKLIFDYASLGIFFRHRLTFSFVLC